jgi:hypothetical protein
MRYIAIFLLLANIGYFSWLRYNFEPSLPYVADTASPLLNRGLVLVSEYQEQLADQSRFSCFNVTGFNTFDSAASFVAELDESWLDATLRLTGDPLESHYRIYLPPSSSRGIATIALDALSDSLVAAEMEIETYLITRGVLENGIALGVFAELDNARDVQAKVVGLGYSPEIEEIPRTTGEIQVQLQALESALVENFEWLDLAADRSDLSFTENLCETIAQGTQFP